MLAILAMTAYLGALLWVSPSLVRVENRPQPNIKAVFGVGLAAVVFHLLSLYPLFFSEGGWNVTIANVGSLISVSVSLIATLALLRWKSMWFPLSIIYALGLVSVALSSFVEGSVIKQLAEDKGLLFHLAIAVFSYALFFIALLYAVQLKWLDYKLKSKKMAFSPLLPPLMTVERHCFALTLTAQGLLTLVLITGTLYLHNFFAPEHLHKAAFSFAAWLVYNILLLGQWKLGWRGKRVLIYSLSGMMLLTFAYFGSRMV